MRLITCLLILWSLAATNTNAQDPVKVDAKHYKVVFENDQVRVLLISYGPNESSPLHEHPATLVVALTDRHERMTGPNQRSQENRVKAGEITVAEGKHSAENLGKIGLEVLAVELKTPEAQKASAASLEALMAKRLPAFSDPGQALPNEARAVAFMRTLNTAEVTFASTYNKGFTEGLNRMGPPPPGGKADENNADFLAPWLAGREAGGSNTTVVRNGYKIIYTPGPGGFGKIAAYTITAQPLQYGGTGIRSFYTDQTAIIRVTSDNRAPTAQDPPL